MNEKTEAIFVSTKIDKEIKFKKDGTPKKGPSEKSLANLIRFKKGQSGNPKGSPTISIQNKLKAAVAKCITKEDVHDIVNKWKDDSKDEEYKIRAEARRDLIGCIIGKPKIEIEAQVSTMTPEEILLRIDEVLGITNESE